MVQAREATAVFIHLVNQSSVVAPAAHRHAVQSSIRPFANLRRTIVPLANGITERMQDRKPHPVSIDFEHDTRRYILATLIRCPIQGAIASFEQRRGG